MIAPAAPGSLGQPVDSRQLYDYLAVATEWLAAARRELDSLDAVILERQAQLTGDLMLALSLWQEASDRISRVLGLWDSGRADVGARTQIATEIWGGERSLPEIGQLLDLVTTKIRQALGLDAGTADHLVRLNRLRAQLERIGESLAALDPSLPIWGRLAEARDRLDTLTAQRERGADISGPLASLETQTAVLDRDAIVATAIEQPSGPRPPDPRIRAYQDLVAWVESLTAIPGTPQPLLDQARGLVHATQTWING